MRFYITNPKNSALEIPTRDSLVPMRGHLSSASNPAQISPDPPLICTDLILPRSVPGSGQVLYAVIRVAVPSRVPQDLRPRVWFQRTHLPQ